MLTAIWNYLYLLPLFLLGFLFLVILYKKRKLRQQKMIELDEEEEIESLANPIAITVILFMSLIYTAFLSPFSPIIPYPLDLITLIWYVAFLIFFAIICKKEGESYQGPKLETKEESELPMKYELIRKMTHGVIIAISLVYIILGPLFMAFIDGLIDLDVGVEYYGQYTVVFFTVIAFLGLGTSEIVRVFFYPYYPLKGVKAIFRRKETGAALGSHISLTVGCMATIFIYGPYYPEIVMASISISAIADGAASIVGRRFGRHEYKTVFSRKRKTLEGLLTATIVSFSLSFIFLIYRFGVYSFILAFIATLVVDIVDWLSLQISDNLLNPLLTSSTMVLGTIILISLNLI